MTETSQQAPTAKLAPASVPTLEPASAPTLEPASAPALAPVAERRQRMPAAERRELVLEAAMTDFAVGGLAGTSTEDVARRAGISQPYLFRLFPTKKALFIELIERCFRRVQDTFVAAAGDRTGEEAPMAMADSYTRLLDE